MSYSISSVRDRPNLAIVFRCAASSSLLRADAARSICRQSQSRAEHASLNQSESFVGVADAMIFHPTKAEIFSTKYLGQTFWSIVLCWQIRAAGAQSSASKISVKLYVSQNRIAVASSGVSVTDMIVVAS